MTYAKIASTRWTLTGPAKSRVQGTDSQYAFEFEHELGCPVQGQPPQGKPLDSCTCYVSRIRLIQTPVGRIIPTTEPDLREGMTFWKNRAEHWERRTWITRGLLVAAGIAASVLGWPGT